MLVEQSFQIVQLGDIGPDVQEKEKIARMLILSKLCTKLLMINMIGVVPATSLQLSFLCVLVSWLRACLTLLTELGLHAVPGHCLQWFQRST